MSLIYFHIFLMVTSIVFSFFMGIQVMGIYWNHKLTIDLVCGVGSFVFGLSVLIYLVWFIRHKLPLMKK